MQCVLRCSSDLCDFLYAQFGYRTPKPQGTDTLC
jgi:hypothetical protein